MRVCVILPAAGSGTRFGGDKLSQDLGGRPVLLRTVELFTKRDEVAHIVVAAPPDALDEFRMRFAAQLSFHGARVVEGGRRERWETVKLALAAVPDDCTHVAVHDAARPAASPELLDRVFAAAQVHDAVIPGIPVTSTLKRVGEQLLAGAEDDALASAILGDVGKERSSARAVLETVPRAGLVAVQTPQVFTTSLLRRAYAAGDPSGATDDAQLVERLGERVVVVDGEARNLKITTQDDLSLIRLVLGAREPDAKPAHKRF
ncbi:MAG: 2-C-methyl-D-erythritol 4-phosphate cytidylyltransferase [Phycisphaerales bacterium]